VRSRRRWGDNEMDLTEIECEGMEWIQVTRVRALCQKEVRT